jgi:hypothetical protein
MSIITVHFHFHGRDRLDVSIDRIHWRGKTWTNPLGTVIKTMESQRGWAKRKDLTVPPPASDREALEQGARVLLQLVEEKRGKLNYLDEEELLDFPWPAAS